MGVEGEPPTEGEIQEVRAILAKKLEEIDAEELDQAFLSKIAAEPDYLARFWKHVFANPGPQTEETAIMVVNTARWRKEFNTGQIQDADFSAQHLERGTLFSRNRDKDGMKLLVFCVGKHVKGIEKAEDMKKLFVYYLERMTREEGLAQFSIVFDCRNAGLKNMDMEFTQFMINTMKDYYPDPLNYIIVFEMPWVLNAAFKIIKAWLPPQAVKKIKFLTKSNMSEYVDDENRLECWGGLDTWEYKFEPESRQPNGSKEEGRKKTVTFAGSPMVASPSADSLGSALSTTSGSGGGGSSGNGPQGVDLLHLSPAQEVIFSTSSLGDLTGKVVLTNTSGKPLGYKIKTTSPEKYRVRPSTGSISPGQAVTVEIHVSGQKEVASLNRDKFLVTAVLLDREDTPAAQLADALRTQTPDGQYRLRCNLAGAAPDAGSAPGPSYAGSLNATSPPQPYSTAAPPEDPARQVANINKKVTQLVEEQQVLQGQVRQLHLLLLLLLLLLLATLLLLLYRLPSSPSDQSSCIHHEAAEPHLPPVGESFPDTEKTEL